MDADAKVIKPIMDGQVALTTKKEDFGIMYAAFCPYHSHTFHVGPCAKWMEKVIARQTQAAAMKKDMETKQAARGDVYKAARAGSASDSRF